MEKMLRAFLILFLFCRQIDKSFGGIIHVSSNSGQDDVNCGTKTTMCRTISYAIDEAAQNDDVIFVYDGTYQFNEPARLRFNLSIVGVMQHKSSSVIIRGPNRISYGKNRVAFINTQSASFLQLQISNLNFENINLFEQTNNLNTLNIFVKDSRYLISYQDIRNPFITLKKDIQLTNLLITDSSISHGRNGKALEITTNGDVNFYLVNVTLDSDNMNITYTGSDEACKGTVVFNNLLFTDKQQGNVQNSLEINNICNVSISNYVYESWQPFQLEIRNVDTFLLKSVRFLKRYSPIVLSYVQNAVISDVTITDVSINNFGPIGYAYMFYLIQTKVKFNNLLVMNNTNVPSIITSQGGDSDTTVDDVIIFENKFIKNVPVLFVQYGNAQFQSIQIYGNELSGSFISIEDCSAIIANVTVQDNVCNSVVKVTAQTCKTEKPEVTMESLHIRRNNCSENIFNCVSSTVQLVNTTIESNKQSGFVLSFLDCDVNFTSTTIQGLGQIIQMNDFKENSDSAISLQNTTAILYPDQRNIIAFKYVMNIKKVIVSLSPETPNIPVISIQLQWHDEYVISSDLTNMLSLHIACPLNFRINSILHRSNETNQLTVQYFCKQCDRGLYSLDGESENASIRMKMKEVHGKIHYEDLTERVVKNLTCNVCPPGGNCNAKNIQSSDHFWGYKDDAGRVQFINCPNEYCCSSSTNPCKTYTTCNQHRDGLLCGECSSGHQLLLFSDQCVDKDECKSISKFWIAFTLLAISYVLVIGSLDYIVTGLKYVWSLLKRSCKAKKCSEREENITGTIFDDQARKNDSPDEFSTDYVQILDMNEPDKDNSSSKLSGIFNVLVSFYQIKSMISITLNSEYQERNILSDYMTGIFNQDLLKFHSFMCPFQDLNAVTKLLIKDLFILVMFTIVTLSFVLTKIFTKLGIWKTSRLVSLQTILKICFLRLLLLNYKKLAVTSMTLINCVHILDRTVLYINGEIDCFTWWQYIAITYAVLWVFPFCPALYLSLKLLKDDKISTAEFFFCLICPFVTVMYMLKRRGEYFHSLHLKEYTEKKVILKVFEDPFRAADDNKGHYIFYDCWKLFSRLTIVLFLVFVVDPLERSCWIIPVILLFLVVHIHTRPYKDNFVNWFETYSLICLSILASINLFRSFLYVYQLPNQQPIVFLLKLFSLFEMIGSPLSFLLLYIIYALLCRSCF